MPSRVAPAETRMPRVASTRMTGSSRLRAAHCRWKAASKIRGGRKAVKMSSLVRAVLGAMGIRARLTPASTRPTV
jgi:hypothetical protein